MKRKPASSKALFRVAPRGLPVALFAAFALLSGGSLRAENSPPAQTLLFTNGNVLNGSLVSISNTVAWRRDDIPQPVQFAPDHLAEVFLGHRRNPSAGSNTACRVRLVNGDELAGDLHSIDAGALRLSTWYGGGLTIPRERVVSVRVDAVGGPVVFDGPDTDAGWTHGDMSGAQSLATNRWLYHNGAFLSTSAASIARDLKLPAECILEYDLEWRGTYALALGLYTDSLQPISLGQREAEPAFKPFYSLQFNTFSVLMMVVPKEGPLRQLGTVPLNIPPNVSQARFTVICSRRQNSVTLLINGQLVKEWVDPNGWSGLGTGFRLVHQGAGAIKLSNLGIHEWDGRTAGFARLQANPQFDLVRFSNGDTFAGSLTGFTNHQFTLTVNGRTVEAPLERVREVHLATGALRHVPGPAQPARLYFAGRGRLTVDLESWSPAGAVIASPNFGRLTVKPEAFSRIQFHPPH